MNSLQIFRGYSQNGFTQLEVLICLALTVISFGGSMHFFATQQRERATYLANVSMSEGISKKLEELLNLPPLDPALEDTSCGGCSPKIDNTGNIQWDVRIITPQLKQISITAPGKFVGLTGYRFNDF